MQEEEQDDGAGAGLIAALPVIIWQRRWLLIVPLVLLAAAGIAAAILTPPVYRSSATVLIESQQLPRDLVNSPVTDVIDQRIARARERVLSRMDLIRLIRANGLYAKEQTKKPLSQIVDKMRDDTTIEAVGANVKAGRSLLGGGTTTIALTIAFDYPDPNKAQLVAQQYVNRFLEVDASAQADQAVGAANFLNDQANSLQAQIAAVDAEITKIKSANGTLLTLGQMSTGDPVGDVTRIDGQIAALEADNARLASAPTANVDANVAQAEINLQSARARYSETHPDVVAAKAQLDAARASAAGNVRPQSAGPQIAANRSQIGSLRTAKAMLQSQNNSVRSAQARAPAIAGRVDQLQKQAESLRTQYEIIGTKLQGAQISARMQTEQKGERLTLADPPVVPDSPLKPNRPMLVLGGIAGGAGLGLALILLVELLLRPIRGTAAMRAAIGEAALVVIPDLSRKGNPILRYLERRHRRKLAKKGRA